MPKARAVCWARSSGLEISSSTGPTKAATAAPAPPPPRRAARRCAPCSFPAAFSAVRPWRTRISTIESVPQGLSGRRRAVRYARTGAGAHGSDRPDARHTQTSRPSPITSSSNRPPSASDLGQGGAAEAGPAERPPEQVGVGPGAVEHEVQQRADRQPEEQPPGGAPADRHEHDDDEQEQAERQRVEHPGASEHPVGQRQDRSDDEQPVVEAGVLEDEPHGGDRRADEPQDHAPARSSGNQQPAALRAVGELARRRGPDGVELGSSRGRGDSPSSGSPPAGRRRPRRSGPATARTARRRQGPGG